MKLPPLKALPVFEAVARLNSFSLAAGELSVGQSAVSHQIKLLETYLGEPLFIRTGRYLALTDEGRQYFDAVSTAQLSDRVADCFITVRPDSPAFSYELLYTERLFPVCSQQYWQTLCCEQEIDPTLQLSQRAPLSPSVLQGYSLLSTHSIYNRAGGDWAAWFDAGGLVLPKGSRLQHFSHMLLALEAARYHQGIAHTNDYMLSNRADSADFIRLPCHYLMTGDQFFFVWKTSPRQEPGIQILRRWLLDQSIESGLRHAVPSSG